MTSPHRSCLHGSGGCSAFHQAELALASAKKELYWAHYRLDHAQQLLDAFGPLSQLRRQGRKEKASTLGKIDTFAADVQKSEAKISRCEQAIEALRPEIGQRRQWGAEHGWPSDRLHAIDVELAGLGQPAHESLTREASLLSRALGEDRPAWLNPVAEVAQPPLPDRDLGAGIDLGL